MGRFDGRIAVVTGAARGIGLGIATRFADEGASVAVLDLDEAQAAAAAEQLATADGQRHVGIGCDVSDSGSVQSAVDRVVAELGALHILVNNAGVTRDNLLFKMTDDDWDLVIGVHLRGAFLMTRAAQKHFVQQKYGKVVCLSSVSALGNRGQANYATAKMGHPGLRPHPRHRARPVRRERQRDRAGLHRHRHDRCHRRPGRDAGGGVPAGRRRSQPGPPRRASPRTSRPRRRSCAATRRRTSPARPCTSTGERSLSPEATPDYIHRTGAPHGFKPYHLVVGAVVLVAWFGVLAFVLTHGRDEASSVDVYSQLPPGFTGALQAKGVTYKGLSPVDAATQSQALATCPRSATTTAASRWSSARRSRSRRAGSAGNGDAGADGRRPGPPGDRRPRRLRRPHQLPASCGLDRVRRDRVLAPAPDGDRVTAPGVACPNLLGPSPHWSGSKVNTLDGDSRATPCPDLVRPDRDRSAADRLRRVVQLQPAGRQTPQ